MENEVEKKVTAFIHVARIGKCGDDDRFGRVKGDPSRNATGDPDRESRMTPLTPRSCLPSPGYITGPGAG